MAAPEIATTWGFVFPRDPNAAVAMRDGEVDETTWLDAVSVPRQLELEIFSPSIISLFRSHGFDHVPKGELTGNTLVLVRNALQKVRRTLAGDAELQTLNRVINGIDRAIHEDLPVWWN